MDYIADWGGFYRRQGPVDEWVPRDTVVYEECVVKESIDILRRWIKQQEGYPDPEDVDTFRGLVGAAVRTRWRAYQHVISMTRDRYLFENILGAMRADSEAEEAFPAEPLYSEEEVESETSYAVLPPKKRPRPGPGRW